MKIVFYSPYLPDHFGGGEKYLFDTALTYANDTKHKVFIALPVTTKKNNLTKIKKSYQQFLGRDLTKINFIVGPFGQRGHQLQKIYWTGKFGVIYYVTDGSAFFSIAKKSIMHIQVPLTIPKKKAWEKIKFNSWQIINTNSYFTKKIVEKYWGVKVNLVCQPGVDTAKFRPLPGGERQKIILNVGRFFDNLHCKNQDVMVEFFRNLRQKNPQLLKDWKLVLIGKVESETYFQRVKTLAKGLPVEILTDVDQATLIEYYQRAAIYWHATGFFADPVEHPEKMEHFGISTVEAMAAGCVPIVIAKGGQVEILGQKLAHLSWLTEAECARKTIKLMRDLDYWQKMSQAVMIRAEKFSLKNFERRSLQMLGKAGKISNN